MKVELLNKPENIEYYVNESETNFYIYNTKENTLKIINKSEFDTTTFEVKIITKKEEYTDILTIKQILKEENNFIKKVKIVIKTNEKVGYYTKNELGLQQHFFNIFLNNKKFIESINNNKYIKYYNDRKKEKNDYNLIYKLFKKECKNLSILIDNLFYYENEIVKVNFLKWLYNVIYLDKYQDVIFIFFGKNDIQQGQGSGKGVLINILNNLLSNLLTTINNSNYKDRFNTSYYNKKLVIFDEVDFKKLDYNYIKNLTGTPLINIEFKGKDKIQIDNTISLLLFSNEYELNNNINIEDRRSFLIYPNPVNNSLLKIVKRKRKYKGNIELFINDIINNELENFTHILYLLKDFKLLKPFELITESKKIYFHNKQKVKEITTSELYKILVNKKYKKYIKDIITYIKSITNNLKTNEILDNFYLELENNFLTFNTFKNFIEVLKNNKIFYSKLSIEKLFYSMSKELEEFNYTRKYHYLKETKRYKGKKLLLLFNKQKTEIKKINEIIRNVYKLNKEPTGNN